MYNFFGCDFEKVHMGDDAQHRVINNGDVKINLPTGAI